MGKSTFLDFRKFKHVKSDKHSTTLRHQDGHELTIAHKGVSPDFKKQLESLGESAKQAQTHNQAEEAQYERTKMAEGGDAKEKPVSMPNPDAAREAAKGAEKSGTTQQVKEGWERLKDVVQHPSHALAEGGEINPKLEQSKEVPPKQMYAEGEDIQPAQQAEINPEDIGNVKEVIPPIPAESPLSLDMADKRNRYNTIVEGQNAGAFFNPEDSNIGAIKRAQFGPEGQPPQQFDPDAWLQMEKERTQEKDANATQLANEALNTAKYNQVALSAGVPPKPLTDVPENQPAEPPASSQSHAQLAQEPQVQQPQSQSADPFSPGAYNSAVNELAGIQKEQLAKQIDARQQAIDTYKNTFSELENERKAHIQDIENGYVDPNKYWESHSKVAAGIGMILAGFNPTTKPNAAIEFLQHQISNSIEAQKQNLAAKNNLLSANLHHFGDLQAATLMTNAMMNDSLAAQMQQAALNAKNPLAKQAGLGAAAALVQNAMSFQQQLAMRQTMMHLANSSNGNTDSQSQAIAMMSAVNPEGAKVYRDAFVPGVGLSRSLTPIPEEVRQQLISHQKLAKADLDLQHFIQTHPKFKIPGTQDYNLAAQKATILQAMIREPLLKTVYREGEQPVLDKLLKSPAGNFLASYNTMPQLRNLIDSNNMQMNTLKQNYNLPTSQAPEQQYSQPVRGKDGRMYQRQGNYMVPIK